MTIYLIPLRKLVIVIVAALKSPQLRCLSVSELIVDNLFCNLFRYLILLIYAAGSEFGLFHQDTVSFVTTS